MKCKHCGTEISNDSVYCEHCGKRQTKLNVFHVPLSWVLFALVFGLSWVYVLLYDLYKVYDFSENHIVMVLLNRCKNTEKPNLQFFSCKNRRNPQIPPVSAVPDLKIPRC